MVYGATLLPKEEPIPFYKSEWLWAIVAIAIFVTLNIYFWQAAARACLEWRLELRQILLAAGIFYTARFAPRRG